MSNVKTLTKTSTKTLYLDFDGTVVNSVKRMAEVYNDNYPFATFLDHNKITTWSAGISNPYIVDSLFNDKNFHSEKLEVFEGCFDTLAYLREEGWKIVLYTKGMLRNIGYKSLWVDEHMKDLIDGWIFIGSDDLKMGKNRYDMSPQSKGDITVILDDHIKNLTNSGCSYAVCAKFRNVSEEWNRGWGELCADDWKDVKMIMGQIDWGWN